MRLEPFAVEALSLLLRQWLVCDRCLVWLNNLLPIA